ncbi:MAG TPA: class I SAM-dependent methyltransferase [Ktedonosporobacter sp.]|nr:class I SAM-dependent methyltransferase [Ktedonosporobacter sp.]
MREWQRAEGPGTYIIDPASGAEIARLMNQEALMKRAVGGLIPEGIDLEHVSHVLDVACGPGGWVQDMAFTYPDLYVVGIDTDQRVVAYALAQARVQALSNASFSVIDITQPLPLPDASFDFINARFLSRLLLRETWADVMREAARVTRPGGWICLIEAEGYGETNSQALQKMEALLMRAMATDPWGRYADIVPRLSRFLDEGGYQRRREGTYVIDCSADSVSHNGYYHNLKVAFKLLQPYMTRMGVAIQEELDRLYERMLWEVLSADFRGSWSLHSICGQKAY